LFPTSPPKTLKLSLKKFDKQNNFANFFSLTQRLRRCKKFPKLFCLPVMNIKVIYEDADIIVVTKPAGVVVHHDERHSSGTVVDWALESYPEIVGVGDRERPGIVHRLDKDTSGVLLIARNQFMYEHLKKLFHEGAVKKTYTALVVGNVKKESGIIDAAIARSTKHFEKRVVGGKQGRAREAVTEYKVREHISSSDGEFTLLDVFPKTGRTHQIRSHLAHSGHPVVCDALYGGKRYACPAGLGRQFLHASIIEFATPDNARMRFEAPLEDDLARGLEMLHARS
jgi:23S rRNA pseudouridine1911/1915/1917 synthase